MVSAWSRSPLMLLCMKRLLIPFLLPLLVKLLLA
jgi:hypothetical protein